MGIGTSTPSFSLHIVEADSTTTGVQARLENTSTTTNSLGTFSLVANGGTVVSQFAVDGLGTGPLATAGGYLGTFTAHPLGLVTDNLVRIFIGDTGNVGIGTTTPVTTLQVVGDIRVGTSGINGCVQNFTGTAIAGTCSSDERLKTNIAAFPRVLDKLAALRPVHYDWKVAEHPEYHFGRGRNSGLVAQEVEKVFPEMVSTDRRGYKMVNYSELPYLLLEGVKELKAENDRLKRQVEELRQTQAQTQALEARLARLEAREKATHARLDSRLRGNDGGGARGPNVRLTGLGAFQPLGR